MKGDDLYLTGCFKMTVSSEPGLVNLIRRYTWGLQHLVNEILADPVQFGEFRSSKRSKRIRWKPIISLIHGKFYRQLKEEFGLPSAIAQCCIREAMSITKSWLNNNSNEKSLPRVKCYRMRVNYQNWHFMKEKGRVTELFIGGYGYVEVENFPRVLAERWNGDYKELIVLYKNGKITCIVTVKKKVKRANPSPRAIAVDLNFNEIVVGNFDVEFRIKTRMSRIMNIKKNHIEKTQKKYNKSWRFIPGVRRAISRWWKRIHNLNDDFIKKTALYIVKTARKLGYDTIVLEDLSNLRLKQSDIKKKSWRERFTFFAYRKLQEWIEWQGLKNEIAVVYVDPRKSSKKCPFCGKDTKQISHRTMKCESCDLTFDKDSLAVLNLVDRYLQQMWGVEVHPERGGWRCSPKNR